MPIFKVKAELREDVGKGASRRLRHAGQVPVVLYGGGRDPKSLTLSHNEVLKLTDDEAFFSSIIEFSAEGGRQKQKVVLKDMQRHPAKPVIMHMDFMRVDDSQELVMNVPLRFEGGEESPAVKYSRVILDYQVNEVEIICYPKDLPEFIAVDVSHFEPGDVLNLSDLVFPEGVRLTVDLDDEEVHDTVIVSTTLIAQEEESDESDDDSGDQEESSEEAATEE